MSARSLLRRRVRVAFACFVRNVRAAVIIEMAFVIPFLVLVGFGGLEIANLTLTTTRISQLGLNTADNASRIATGSNLAQPQVREADINDVFAGVEKQAGNLDFQQHGRIILSSLERNSDGGQWIHWQRCFGDLNVDSSYGDEGEGQSGTDFPGMGAEGAEVTAVAGTAVMFVEIVYEYQPLLYGKWLGAKTIRSTAAFNIREARDLAQIYNPSPAATAATCS